MESSVAGGVEAGELACRRRAGEACTCYAYPRQGVARKGRLAFCCGLCSCGFYAHQCKTTAFEIQAACDDNEENFRSGKEKHRSQNEMKSCPLSYPMKKIACLRWRLDASCC
jgi:hypothetical protein